MKILSEGKRWFLEIPCESCKAKLEIEEADVFWEHCEASDDILSLTGLENLMRNYYFRCPGCRHKAYLLRGVLPFDSYKYTGAIPVHVLENASTEKTSK